MTYAENTAILGGGGEHLNSVIVPPGTTRFSQHLTEAREMCVDLLNLALDPPGYIAVLKEARATGMFDEGLTVSLCTVTLATGTAIPDILANYDIYSAKELLNHDSAETTKEYSRLKDDDLADKARQSW
jgi:ABC-type branched-subunit amino acid transport system substrate-binding protein